MQKRYLAAILLPMALAACGGSGDDDVISRITKGAKREIKLVQLRPYIGTWQGRCTNDSTFAAQPFIKTISMQMPTLRDELHEETAPTTVTYQFFNPLDAQCKQPSVAELTQTGNVHYDGSTVENGNRRALLSLTVHRMKEWGNAMLAADIGNYLRNPGQSWLGVASLSSDSKQMILTFAQIPGAQRPVQFGANDIYTKK